MSSPFVRIFYAVCDVVIIHFDQPSIHITFVYTAIKWKAQEEEVARFLPFFMQ